MKSIKNLILAVVSFLGTLPFIIDVFVLDHGYHTFPPMITFFIILEVICAPLFAYSLMRLFLRPGYGLGGNDSSVESDLARIRNIIERPYK